MPLFDKDKKLVVIYLSKTACLDYTKVMIKGFKNLDPLLVISQRNAVAFSDYESDIFLSNASLLSDFIFSLTIISRVKKLLDKLEIEHGPLQLYFPAFHPLNHLFLSWVANHNSCTSYLTIHDAITHKGESSRLIEKLQQKGVGLATKVICLTNYVRKQLVAKVGYEEKIIVHPHPIIPAGTINILNHTQHPKILFLGRVLKYKGIDNLLHAIHDLDIGKLTIAGRQYQKIKVNSPRIDVIDRILSDSEISRLLSEHHILVLPYLEASQSGVLALGIDAEMVMVISKVGGLQEQLPEDAAIWVNANELSLREGILELMDDKTKYASIKQKVRRYKDDQQT